MVSGVNKTVKDGVTEYNSVETYATSSLDATTTVADVQVKATYKGSAAGVYGHKTFMESGDANVISAGTFTAGVELNAYFGVSADVAASKHNTVQGMVSDFVLSGGQDNNWNLAIKSKSGQDVGITTVDGEITVSGTTDGGGVNPEGANNWNGAFHEKPLQITVALLMSMNLLALQFSSVSSTATSSTAMQPEHSEQGCRRNRS